jgi:tetratricopeptide (TPR) repeat protein
MAAVCAVVAIYLGLGAADASRVQRGNDLGADGHYAAALRAVENVHRAPSDAAALLVRARALTRLGERRAADGAWRAATRRMPNDWKLQVEWFREIVALRGSRALALRVYARARELNPRLPAFGTRP